MNGTEITLTRANALIDPQLAIWGWEIPVYLFLGGLSAGLLVVSALLLRRTGDAPSARGLRFAPLAAVALLSVGMLALFLDLEHKWHVYRFYLALRLTSPMSWGSWILVAVYPAALLATLGLLDEGEWRWLTALPVARTPVLTRALTSLRSWAQARLTSLHLVNLALGTALGFYTGVLLGTLGARATWSSPLLGPLFLTSGISTGAALLMLMPMGDDDHARLRRYDVIAISVELALLALLFAGFLTSGGAAGHTATALFFGGAYTAPFFALVVMAGLLVPLALEAIEARRGLHVALVTPMLVLVGGLALRFILVSAGQAA